MKRAAKIIGVIVLVLVVLLIGGFFWIDGIAKVGVEKGATFALGVETTLERMSIGVFSGEAGMSKLNVRNPAGFDTPHFLELGNGNVAVSLGSLMDDTVVVPELTLSSLSMNLERKGGRANYQVILDGLKRFDTKEDAPPPAPQDDGPAEEGKKFVVRHVAIDDVNVQVDWLPVGGELTRVPLRIERIELNDVGSESVNGVQLAELTGILLKAILESVLAKGGDLIPADIAGELTMGLEELTGLGDATVQVVGDVTTIVDGQVREVGEAGKELLQKLGEGGAQLGKDADDIGKKVGEGLEDVGKKLEEGIGGLLPKKKKEQDNP